jgi:hypothetical protein
MEKGMFGMKYGFSGAEIFFSADKVLKKMPKAAAQAEHMKKLGLQVSPRVLEVAADYYVMERLLEPTPRALISRTMVKIVLDTLAKNVHCYPAIITMQIAKLDWRQELATFLATKSPAMNLVLFKLYPKLDPNAYCMTHGDCTLANVMVSDGGRIRLIDPLPPGGKIPGLKEVDYGKLLQSCLGWEGLISKQSSPTSAELLTAELMIGLPSQDMQNKAWFWCGVHLLRILPYASGKPEVEAWCWLKLKECLNAIRI